MRAPLLALLLALVCALLAAWGTPLEDEDLDMELDLLMQELEEEEGQEWEDEEEEEEGAGSSRFFGGPPAAPRPPVTTASPVEKLAAKAMVDPNKAKGIAAFSAPGAAKGRLDSISGKGKTKEQLEAEKAKALKEIEKHPKKAADMDRKLLRTTQVQRGINKVNVFRSKDERKTRDQNLSVKGTQLKNNLAKETDPKTGKKVGAKELFQRQSAEKESKAVGEKYDKKIAKKSPTEQLLNEEEEEEEA